MTIVTGSHGEGAVAESVYLIHALEGKREGRREKRLGKEGEGREEGKER